MMCSPFSFTEWCSCWPTVSSFLGQTLVMSHIYKILQVCICAYIYIYKNLLGLARYFDGEKGHSKSTLVSLWFAACKEAHGMDVSKPCALQGFHFNGNALPRFKWFARLWFFGIYIYIYKCIWGYIFVELWLWDSPCGGLWGEGFHFIRKNNI